MIIRSAKRVVMVLGAIAVSSLVPVIAIAETKPADSMKPDTMTATGSSSSIIGQLNLSEQQKNKIRGIRAARTRQINQVLKPEQRTQLQAELKSGKKLGEAVKALNLDANQKKQILSIVQKSNQSVMATLDPKQRTQLQAYLKQHHQSSTQMPIE